MADSQRKTANLYDGTTSATNARLSTSGTGTYAVQGWSVSSYIPINPSTNYCTNLSTQSFYCLYNENKGFLVGGIITKATPSPRTYADAKFIRFDFPTDSLPEVQLSEGTTGQDYEPYGWLHSLRKLTTATEAVENPLYSDGTAITAYTLKGNTVQSGTPTPSNPVDVNGVGERTENLFDVSTAKDTQYYIDVQGSLLIGSNGDRFIAQKVKVTPLTEYTFSWGNTILGTENNSPHIRVVEYANTKFLGRTLCKCIDYANKIFTIITSQNTNVLDIRYDSGTSLRQQTITNLMLNEGSTALPYEAYGYKIPISSGGATTNIYLGSTQTVRQIKKLVLTGDESSWRTTGSGAYTLALTSTEMRQTSCYCTHYIGTISGSVVDGECTVNTSTDEMVVRDNNVTNLTSYKQWLAAQYVNGTPVILYYVLATPETATVNEPLMKIGTYADTLSNAASIPTTEGANSITVDTTVQPSEFTATWTGWHDASVKEWDGSQWNE